MRCCATSRCASRPSRFVPQPTRKGDALMWMILALSAALQPAQAKAGDLELNNVRFTRGVLGSAREGNKYLPGDLVVLSFDAKGLKADAAGRVRFALGVELRRKGAAKAEHTQAPEDREAAMPFGG